MNRQAVFQFAREVPAEDRLRLEQLGLDPETAAEALRAYPTMERADEARRAEAERKKWERLQRHRERMRMADALLAGDHGKDAKAAAEIVLAKGRTTEALLVCARLVWEANERKRLAARRR